MKSPLFYKNDSIRWRWEDGSKIIIYRNDRYWTLNETASIIFYYCNGVDLSQLVGSFKCADLNNNHTRFIVKKFLNDLLKKEIITSRFNGDKVGFGDNIAPRYNLPKFIKPDIKSFDLGYMDYSRFARPRYPLRVFFTITHECNLKCAHCYNLPEKGDDRGIDLHRIRKIVDRIKAAGVFEVILTGGESFLNPHIFDIIDCILSRDMKVRINTNGMLLKDKEIKELGKRKDITLSMGMDGVSSRSNDLIRGEGHFKKAIAILEKLSKEGIDTYINFTATHRNFSDIFRLRRFFKDFNVSRIIVNTFIRAGRGREHSDTLALNKLEFGFLKCLGYLNRDGIGRPMVTIITSCYGGHIETNIDHEGSIFFCELLHHPLGNILEENIGEIWNSPQMLSLMDVDRFDFPCKACFFRKRCRGSCRAEVFSTTGDLYAGNPHCLKGRIISRLPLVLK